MTRVMFRSVYSRKRASLSLSCDSVKLDNVAETEKDLWFLTSSFTHGLILYIATLCCLREGLVAQMVLSSIW